MTSGPRALLQHCPCDARCAAERIQYHRGQPLFPVGLALVAWWALGATVALRASAESPAVAIAAEADPPQTPIVPTVATARGILQHVGIDQHLGRQLPLESPWVDESGTSVTLGDYFGERPVVLALVYYQCPMLCTQVLNGALKALRALPLEPGRDYDVVIVSFDPREGPDLAHAKKTSYLARYGRPGADEGWHFLTGPADSIAAITQAAGFRYRYDEASRQFAHASAITVATPEGRLARYFYGIDYIPRDLRLGIVEAAAERIGSPVDAVLLYCFHYDPLTGTYSLAVMRLIRTAGVATVVALGSFVLLALRRERRAARLGRSPADSRQPTVAARPGGLAPTDSALPAAAPGGGTPQ